MQNSSTTALHRSSAMGHLGVVGVLLEEGEVPVDVRGDRGRTPLWLAAFHGRDRVGIEEGFFD